VDTEAQQGTREAYTKVVHAQLKQWVRWTRMWSVAHHGSLFLAALLSAAAALVLQLKSITWSADTKADAAAVLAASAAVLGGISSAGGFARKWRTNRLTRSKLEQLNLYLMDPDCDLKMVERELVEMVKVHNEGILSGEEQAGG